MSAWTVQDVIDVNEVNKIVQSNLKFQEDILAKKDTKSFFTVFFFSFSAIQPHTAKEWLLVCCEREDEKNKIKGTRENCE